MAETCKGSPPDRPVDWIIKTKDGKTRFGRGQTAFVAAADAGLALAETEHMGSME